MPIYEYQCRVCGHEFEAMHKVSDQPLVDCPACGQPELTKLVSAAGFRLKGGGWYETDFKGGSETKRNLVGDAGESKSTPEKKPADSGKDSKPAAAAPEKKSSGTTG
jgi:putative FmdB family regulatory protein